MIKQSRSAPMRKIWILGAGKFGRLAMESIVRHIPEVEITLVDKRVIEVDGKAVTSFCGDGVSWLAENMGRDDSPDMVIPAIPVHMLAEWLKTKSEGSYSIVPAPFPKHLMTRLPHPIQNGHSQVYVSHADFLCPDNCGEPELFCSYTGKERGEDMFRLLGKLKDTGCMSLVVRSYQLFPGVGGIYPGDMWRLLDSAYRFPDQPLLIATACRCHGVVDCLQFALKNGDSEISHPRTGIIACSE